MASPVLPVAVAPAMTRSGGSGGVGPVTAASLRGYRVPMATDVPEQRQVRRGREARQAARLARAVDTLPYLTRKLPPVEVISDGGPRADRAQRRHPPRDGRHRDRQLPRGGRDLPFGRSRRRRPAGALPARAVPLSSSPPRPRGSSPNAPATPRGRWSSAIPTWSSSRPTARRSCTTSTTAGATRRSRTSATS